MLQKIESKKRLLIVKKRGNCNVNDIYIINNIITEDFNKQHYKISTNIADIIDTILINYQTALTINIIRFICKK